MEALNSSRKTDCYDFGLADELVEEKAGHFLFTIQSIYDMYMKLLRR